MAGGKRPREIDDTERARSMPEAEATALSTIAMAMFLSVLAEAEAAKRQQPNALQPDETVPQSTPPPPPGTTHAVAAAPPADTSSPPQAEQDPATLPAHPEFATLVEPSQASEADRQQADTAATAIASPSAEHTVATSGFIPDPPLSIQIDSAGWTGLTGTPAAPASHEGPTPSLSLADGLHDTMTRLTTTVSDIGMDLQHQLASVTTDLSNLTTAIVSDLSHLNTTISETVVNVTHVAASVPATIADLLVSGVFGSAPQSPAPDTPDHSVPMLDTGSIVPVSVDHAPLQLGFLGQPHVEGHDPHDGAFSALGIH
jgi:hypothetical protein